MLFNHQIIGLVGLEMVNILVPPNIFFEESVTSVIVLKRLKTVIHFFLAKNHCKITVSDLSIETDLQIFT